MVSGVCFHTAWIFHGRMISIMVKVRRLVPQVQGFKGCKRTRLDRI